MLNVPITTSMRAKTNAASSSPVGGRARPAHGTRPIDPAAVPVGKLGDGGQVGDPGAFHAEHRVHDDDPAALPLGAAA